uniref:Glycosyltransferase n=1 Tax=Kalanchoe fedtschenkoi TaxID=63787 RepID=A0A7N0UM17_KALFE
MEAKVKQFQEAVPGSLDELIRRQLDGGQAQPKIIVYDSLLPWALDVADRNGLAAAPFFTQTCSVSSIYYLFREGKLTAGEEAEKELCLYGLPRLEERDLPTFVPDPEASPFLLGLLVGQFSNLERAAYVFFNTFDKLEDQMVEWMASKWPILTVGPTLPSMHLDKCIEDDKSYGLNLFKPNRQTCLDWLDKRQARSVIYVSFGSLAVLEQQQMNEIAECLEKLHTHFIWVVRETEMGKLSSQFMEGNLKSGLGLVVTWCDQLDVLAHESVGCFVTHCGCNSTLEALCLGVPMVGMPKWSDQPTNAKFVEDVWRVGVRCREDENGIVRKVELERCVRVVLEDEEIRRNAARVKEWALEAIQDGGSSHTNINKFVSALTTSDA